MNIKEEDDEEEEYHDHYLALVKDIKLVAKVENTKVTCVRAGMDRRYQHINEIKVLNYKQAIEEV